MRLIACNQQRRVELMNPVAQQLTGWTLEEAKGRRLETIFRTVDEETREPVKNPGGGDRKTPQRRITRCCWRKTARST